MLDGMTRFITHRMTPFLLGKIGRQPSSPGVKRRLYVSGVLFACLMSSLYLENRLPNVLTEAFVDGVGLSIGIYAIYTAKRKSEWLAASLLYWLITFCLLSTLVYRIAVPLGIVITVMALVTLLRSSARQPRHHASP